MTLTAHFVLNNPALLLKSYDFYPANLHRLNLARNKKLKQIHTHGDPARYRAYFPRYLLKCLQDHCHHHHETLYKELKHASYSIEHILDSLQHNQHEHTTVLAQAHALLSRSHYKKDTHARAKQMTLGL